MTRCALICRANHADLAPKIKFEATAKNSLRLSPITYAGTASNPLIVFVFLAAVVISQWSGDFLVQHFLYSSGLTPKLVQHLLAPIKKRVNNGAVKSRLSV